MLKGKHIIITGIARGIGLALAELLLKQGAIVSGFDVLEQELNAYSKKHTKSFVERVNITNQEEVSQFVQSSLSQNGPIDGVINCAGVTHIALAKDTNESDYQRVIEINLLGTIRVCQLCLESISQQNGFIVGISSVAGFGPLYYRTAYAASKHGVIGYLSSLRSELEENRVQVMTVCPGYVETKLQQDYSKFSNNTGESMTPTYVASKIIDGLNKKRDLILIGSTAKKAYWFSRLFPNLYRKIMSRKTK